MLEYDTCLLRIVDKEVIPIGVKFGREYNDIVDDLSEAIVQVDSFYDFLDMSEQDWNRLSEFDQKECLKTLADDVFFALGNQRKIKLGRGVVFYSQQKHIITVEDGQNVTIVVKLI